MGKSSQCKDVIGGISAKSNSPILCLAELTVVLPKIFADFLLIIISLYVVYMHSFVFFLVLPWPSERRGR